MSDISDIVLRIRVDIVNSQAIQGLVGNLGRAQSAVRNVSKTNKAAVGSFSMLGNGFERTSSAATMLRKTNAGLVTGQHSLIASSLKNTNVQNMNNVVNRNLAKGVKLLTGTQVKAGSTSRTNTALNAKLAAGVQKLTASSVKYGDTSKTNTSINAKLAKGVSILRGAQTKVGATTKTNTGLNQKLAAGVAKVTNASSKSSLADNERYQTSLRLAKGVATVTAQGRARVVAEERQRQSAQRLSAETARLNEKNKQLYSTSALVGRAAGFMRKQFQRIIDPLSKVERSMDAVFRAGVHMQSMGRDLLNFAKKMVGFGKQLVDAWGDFEFTLNRAAAAGDIFDVQSPIYDKLKQSVYALSRELRVFPAEEVAKGLYFWQSTTGEVIKTQEDLARTTKNVSAVMKLAAMTDTDYETAIKGVYSTLKQFNLKMTDTADVTSLLFFATQKTALEFPDLIGSLKMVGTMAGQAKEPLKTIVGILGAVGNAGIRGSMAGRALRQTYRKIVHPTAAARKELDKLFKSQGGYNKVAFNSKGNFIGMEKYVMKLAKATKGLSYEQRGAIMSTITTANEQGVMMAMMGMADRAIETGAKSWVEFAVSQQRANEVFNRSWGILQQSWRGVVGGLKQSVQPIMLEVGRIIAKVFTPALQELADVFFDMGPAMGDIAKQIGEDFKPLINWISGIIKTGARWIKKNKEIVASVAKFAIVGGIVAGVAGAFLLLAGTVTLLVANLAIVLLGALPLIAVFVAIGAVIVAFAAGVYRNVGGIKDSMKRFGDAVVHAFKLFMGVGDDASITAQDLADAFISFSDAVTNKIARILDIISGALERLTPEQVSIIKKIVKALIGLKLLNTGLGISIGIIKGLTGNIRLMAGAMKTATPKILNFLGAFKPSNIKKAIDGMSNLATSVTNNMKTIGSTLAKGASGGAGLAQSGAEMAIKVVSGFVGGLAGAAATAVAAIAGWPAIIVAAIVAAVVAAIAAAYATNFLGFKDFVDGIGRWITDVAVPAVLDFGKNIADAFGRGVQAIVTWVGDVIAWFGQLPQSIADFAGQVIDNITGFIGSLVETIVGGLTEFANNWDYYLGYILGVIIAFPIRVIAEIVKFGVGLVATVITFLGQVVENFGTFFGQVLTNLINWFATTIPTIAKAAGDLIGGIIDWVQKLPGRIAYFFGMVLGKLVGWFTTNVPIIAAKAGDLIGGIIDWFRKLPGRVADFFGSVLSNITGWFSTNIPIIINKARLLIVGIVDWFKALPGNIVDALVDLPGTIKDVFVNLAKAGGSLIKQIIKVGEAIIRGIWQGVLNMVGWLTDKLGGFFGGLVDGIKDTLGIQSPSKVFADIGKYMIDGLAKGISSTDSAVSAMNGVLSDITGAAGNAQKVLDATNVGGTFNQSQSNETTRKVELKVDVTSADGSVNSMDMETLAGLITGSDMTRTLERMSTVD